MFTKQDLLNFQPRHDTFVGIDSDGCVFPTMEVKQKDCFHPEIIRAWGLEKIARQVRECAEFVNLRSKWRGMNRFPALLKTFSFLHSREDVRDAGVPLPDLAALQRYVESGLSLSNATLKAEVERTGDPELKRLLAWSLTINEVVARTVQRLAPFRGVRECLAKMGLRSDLIVVSQTPEEALLREWEENGMTGCVAVIAGQELGTKAEHIDMATRGRYAGDRILMIGDAPGDLRAAMACRACFYPIDPGREEESWERLHDEAYDRFLSGTYMGPYEKALIERFEQILPETPPWS